MIYAFVAPGLLAFLAFNQDWFRDARPWVDPKYNQDALLNGGLSGRAVVPPRGDHHGVAGPAARHRRGHAPALGGEVGMTTADSCHRHSTPEGDAGRRPAPSLSTATAHRTSSRSAPSPLRHRVLRGARSGQGCLDQRPRLAHHARRAPPRQAPRPKQLRASSPARRHPRHRPCRHRRGGRRRRDPWRVGDHVFGEGAAARSRTTPRARRPAGRPPQRCEVRRSGYATPGCDHRDAHPRRCRIRPRATRSS